MFNPFKRLKHLNRTNSPLLHALRLWFLVRPGEYTVIDRLYVLCYIVFVVLAMTGRIN